MQSTHRFGEFRLHSGPREIFRSDQRVETSARVFDFLVYLIENRDRAVSRNEILRAVWRRSDVSDEVVAQVVLKARKIVDAGSTTVSSIRTIKRFGYQWAVTTESTTSAMSASEDPLPPDVNQSREPEVRRLTVRAVMRWRLHFLTGAAAFTIGITAFRWSDAPLADASHSWDAPTNRSTVAVMPATLSSAVTEQWIEFGLMNVVARRLSSAGLLVVPNDTTAASVRHLIPPLREEAVSKATSAGSLVRTQVDRVAQTWTVRLHIAEGSRYAGSSSGSDANLVSAARAAADALAGQVGALPGPPEDGDKSRFLAADAALLANELEEAHRLLITAADDKRESADLLLRLAEVNARMGRVELARTGFQHVLGQPGSSVSLVLRARALVGLGGVSTGAIEQRQSYYDGAIALLTPMAESQDLGRAYRGRAIVHANQRRFDLASADFARARIVFDVLADPYQSALVDANEGTMDYMRGQPAMALTNLTRATSRLEAFDAKRTVAIMLGNQVEALLELMRPVEALEASRRLQRLLPVLLAKTDRNLALYRHARALTANGLFRESEVVYPVAAESPLLDEPGRSHRLALAHWAQVAFAEDRYEDAAAFAERSLAAPADAALETVTAETWLLWTRALRRGARAREAASQTHLFSVWAGTAPDGATRTYSHIARAEQDWADHRREAASERYEAAIASARRMASPSVLVDVLVSYGNALVAAGELERARSVVGELGKYADVSFHCALLQAKFYWALGRADAWDRSLGAARRIAGQRSIPLDVSKGPVPSI